MKASIPPVGLSVRAPWLAGAPALGLDRVEVVADAWLWATDDELRPLERLRRDAPFYLHALGLNLGSTDGLDPEYVDLVGRLAARLEVDAVSDHFAWRSVDGAWSSTFLPLPLHREVIAHVASRVHAVQDRLRRPLVLETPAEYADIHPPGVTIADALWALYEACGCGALVDTCNLRVSAHNLGGDPEAVVRRLAPITVYTHVAGFSRGAGMWLDDHGAAPEGRTVHLGAMTGAPLVLEWDRDPPGLRGIDATLREMRARLKTFDADDGRPTVPGASPASDNGPPAPFPELPDAPSTPDASPASDRGPPATFPGLRAWSRSFMRELSRPSSPGFKVLHADQIHAALQLLSDTYPTTGATLGPNFRWFVREFVRAVPARDVHGLGWVPRFGRWLRGRPELATHAERPNLEREWERHA